MINGLDLFSGIGGITEAISPWVTPIAYCERDRYAQSVLLSRIWNMEIPDAPIWDDVTTITGEHLPLPVDIIYGGFPCQDISLAGSRAGLEGERSGLFFEVERLVSEIRPRFVFLENVPALRSAGADVVGGRLASLRYDCRWGMLSAADMGAPHKRERWWLLAYANRISIRIKPELIARRKTALVSRIHGPQGSLAHADGARLEREWRQPEQSRFTDGSWWATEPDVGRVADGVPARVDRIKSLGNAVVPAVAREAFKRLMGIES